MDPLMLTTSRVADINASGITTPIPLMVSYGAYVIGITWPKSCCTHFSCLKECIGAIDITVCVVLTPILMPVASHD